VSRNGALFSSCGRYRYELHRQLEPELDAQASYGTIAFIGCNPSTADADDDDATTRKMRGFARVIGAREYLLGNVFAYCATDVYDLAGAQDPVGPDNDAHLAFIVSRAELIIPCWGAREKIPQRLWPHIDAVATMLMVTGKPLKAFGVTKSGDPAHPVRLGYSTGLIDWRRLA